MSLPRGVNGRAPWPLSFTARPESLPAPVSLANLQRASNSLQPTIHAHLVMNARPIELELTRLHARVAALEAALHRRSEQLRRLQQLLPVELLALVEQAASEFPAGDPEAFDVESWRETYSPVPATVEPLMERLWRSIGDTPPQCRHDR